MIKGLETGASLQWDVPMAGYTSFKTGGKAKALALPRDLEALIQCVSWAQEQGMPYMVMGNGSDILVRDGGYPGLLIKMGEAFSWTRMLKKGELQCGSGTLLSQVARFAMEQGCSGLAFASGIPGSMGGAIYMNAGAYGGEMKDVVKEVTLFSPTKGQCQRVPGSQLDLAYRHSRIQETKEVVLDVTLTLQPGNREEILQEMNELMRRRNRKQPVNFPSAGSFFKRPTGHFAGKLIEEAGLRGLRVGDAQVSEKHCGFIINRGGASATEILELMHLVQEKVKAHSGVELEPEVEIVGVD